MGVCRTSEVVADGSAGAGVASSFQHQFGVGDEQL